MAQENIQQAEPHVNKERYNFLANRMTSGLIIGILILCVGWLFYKVNKLEKSLALTQSELTLQRRFTLLRRFEYYYDVSR
jgi:hypothetical protein